MPSGVKRLTCFVLYKFRDKRFILELTDWV